MGCLKPPILPLPVKFWEVCNFNNGICTATALESLPGDQKGHAAHLHMFEAVSSFQPLSPSDLIWASVWGESFWVPFPAPQPLFVKNWVRLFLRVIKMTPKLFLRLKVVNLLMRQGTETKVANWARRTALGIESRADGAGADQCHLVRVRG